MVSVQFILAIGEKKKENKKKYDSTEKAGHLA
jgi:hypothetical protein